ncbi:NIPSNAP family protein, partial [Synechocystis sp. LEGE 06083]|nr:NIPSNAP family protein [Synechocystis sp. LEGE 06083]
ERQRLRAELQASDEWQAYAKQMRPLVQSIENKILIPEPWSPIGGENKN